MSIQAFQFTDTLSICGQIQADDVAQLAASGFKTIVCMRPDNEEPNQPSFDAIQQSANAHNIDTVHLPMMGLPYVESHAQRLKQVLDSDQPVFMYCRSGMRAITLWSYVQQDAGMPVNEILERVAHAPYDQTMIKAQLDARAQA